MEITNSRHVGNGEIQAQDNQTGIQSSLFCNGILMLMFLGLRWVECCCIGRRGLFLETITNDETKGEKVDFFPWSSKQLSFCGSFMST